MTLPSGTLCKAAILETGEVELLLPGAKPLRVTYDSFLKFLEQSVVEVSDLKVEASEEALGTGTQYPIGVVRESVSGSMGREIRTFWVVRQSRREVVRHDNLDEPYTIPLPRMCIKLVMQRNADERDYWTVLTDRVRYYAFWGSVQSLRDGSMESMPNSAAVLPLPNMYDSGRMCFGSVTLDTRVNSSYLSIMDSYYDLIHESVFNEDLAVRSVNWGEALRYIKGYAGRLRPDFPLSEDVRRLVESPSYRPNLSGQVWIEFLSLFRTFPYQFIEGYSDSYVDSVAAPEGQVRPEILIPKPGVESFERPAPDSSLDSHPSSDEAEAIEVHPLPDGDAEEGQIDRTAPEPAPGPDQAYVLQGR